ncbi:protein abnormal spindle [Bicyclus anynana]|uniref:Protein abnormal spindle n=1 Tax=Bicyclus anynana TaxID=110368 RepID=A0A6J1NE06_BICAN|nr:protein abnormal spindle [Bicyclus anynana]
MYFQIENTPENVKRARKKKNVEVIQEECPRLILAPFSKPPQVVFDNIVIGTTCEKELELSNPTKNAQQITLAETLPPGLTINLPGECLEIEPETCYCVSMEWTPAQIISMRKTIRFTNENRGRYDIIVVLKSVMPAKGKCNQSKVKTSPGKIKKRTTKKSPVALNKKKIEAVCSTGAIKKSVSVAQSTQYKVFSATNKENNDPHNDYSMDSNFYNYNPFNSLSSSDIRTSDLFSNMQRPKPTLYDTYDKSDIKLVDDSAHVSNNVLKPFNKQACANTSASDLFDNLTFTPLKGIQSKNDKLEKGPKVIISVNSDSDFDDSVDIKNSNKENETHSIICVTSIQQPTKWLTNVHENTQSNETPVLKKKIPNTSSPKDFNSPNFSINTDFSRISETSFLPQRYSTERKVYPKMNNETHDIVDDSNMNVKISSDTYTKESPITPLDYRTNRLNSEFRHLPNFMKEPFPKMCRQSLFKEQQHYRDLNERNYLAMSENFRWHNDMSVRSPPRSLTPPLQSIPEESIQFSGTQISDKHTATFTIDQTFARPSDVSFASTDRQLMWSKSCKRAEPPVWKIPAPVTKKSIKTKTKESLNNKRNSIQEKNTSVNQNSYLNYVDDVYSQSFTVDPFLSSTYYYDKDAVENFEREFKKWLNCILTPPADLDSNIEQKVDVAKAWIENRNKEVPLAPTKEQVCNAYHNSHRLESLRRSARTLLRSPEINQVYLKLQAQIEKKLIAIRNDKNLHLDVGLQKIIMEILLSYNPLWLRIGLEVIYGLILPLKSNNDFEGLTTFIIHRMFKNPNLKNKHSKTSAPNMLLPAYIEAIKKFTLKKFFILVFFLDQAKQKKLIPHDPCLFRRNALYKESKEIIINFTKELIAGIGDITKHLRPLGYVVSHKQSYLDEYIFAVKNIAVDIRDGVRLTKVMEIILMRNGLLHQLRTPAENRLRKIHNVQVALNALKEANFVIVGDISAADIADGHREKTLSLLWQLIHVFRAPLFVTAATTIQTWWRKKYEVIIAKRKEEERLLARLNTASSKIQFWWRKIQYNRMVEHRMQKDTKMAIIIQKYWRMWLCRNQLRKLKLSVNKISEFYINCKLKKQAKETLQLLRAQKELRYKSAICIQRYFRAYLKKKDQRNKYLRLKTFVILIQVRYRSILTMRRERAAYLKLRNAVVLIQRIYRANKLMKESRYEYEKLREAALVVQSRYRALILMREIRANYIKLKSSCIIIQNAYRAYLQGKEQRQIYLNQKRSAVTIQRWYRSLKQAKEIRQQYVIKKQACTTIQIFCKAYIVGKKQRLEYINMKTATVCIQKHFRSYLLTKSIRTEFLEMKKSTVVIQRFYRSWLETKKLRERYLKIRQATITIQLYYREYLITKTTRQAYCNLKSAAICIQQRYRSLLSMRVDRELYLNLRRCTINIQRRFRALLAMKRQRHDYLRQRAAIITIQKSFRSLSLMKLERSKYLRLVQSCITIQTRYRAYKVGKDQRNKYLQLKNAANKIHQRFRALKEMRKERQRYLQERSAAATIQRRFRARRLMLQERSMFTKTVAACVSIQRFYKAHLIGVKQRETNTIMRSSAIIIQRRWREYRKAKMERNSFIKLRNATILIQRLFRSKIETRMMVRKMAVFKIQTWYLSIKQRNECRSKFIDIRSKIITLQACYRAYICRKRYLSMRQASITIQRYYRNYKLAKSQRESYIRLKWSVIKLQAYVRGSIQRRRYLRLRETVLTAQAVYRFKKHLALVLKRRDEAAICIQKNIRRFLTQSRYNLLREKVIFIQKIWRSKLAARLVRCEFSQKRRIVVKLQAAIRGFLARKDFQNRKVDYLKTKDERRRNWAALKIQALFIGHMARKAAGARAARIRSRWRNGALLSDQPTLKERNEEALNIIFKFSDIAKVLDAFESLKLLTEVMPVAFEADAPAVVKRVFLYMSTMNRSISSVEVLRAGAGVLVNLTRYRGTGPQIYTRDLILPTLKFMWRFCSSDPQLFCILSTYIWLFSKYDSIKKDLTEYLHMPENHKILVSIKANTHRMKRMHQNLRNSVYSTPQPSCAYTRTSNQCNMSLWAENSFSICRANGNASIVLPATEPDYGIVRANSPQYFENAQDAITCIYDVYGLQHLSG